MDQTEPNLQALGNEQDVAFLAETPAYGENYGRGWIGFNHASSWMSKGIARLTRARRESGIPISHAFIVTGEDECVEAAFGKGVVVSSLREAYFEREDRYVVFRKPRELNDAIADEIVRVANEQVGTEFNNAVLVASGITENFVGRLVNRLFDGKPKDFLAKLAKDEDRWICSELAAYCLNEQPQYRDRGVLKHPVTAIEPQRLFEDDELFEPLETTIKD